MGVGVRLVSVLRDFFFFGVGLLLGFLREGKEGLQICMIMLPILPVLVKDSARLEAVVGLPISPSCLE